MPVTLFWTSRQRGGGAFFLRVGPIANERYELMDGGGGLPMYVFGATHKCKTKFKTVEVDFGSRGFAVCTRATVEH